MSALPEALGQSESFLAFMEALSRVARVERPVVIQGQRGTGKELAAARLHYLSPRWQGPFVALNCAALPASLLDTELFGHEAGAFTGAARQRKGRFERAHGGTLFLDEIASMDMAVQEKVLRAVEYGSFERVGGEETVAVDVRIVAASNLDLPGLVHAGEFRADLLDRLAFEVLTLPPLKARGEDILLLAERFAARMALELEAEDVPTLGAAATATLLAHDWPGNVRELKNVVERAVARAVLEERELVEDLELDPFASPYRPQVETGGEDAERGTVELRADPAELSKNLDEDVRAYEIVQLRQALSLSRHNQRQAAARLGLSYSRFRTLYRKYKSALDES